MKKSLLSFALILAAQASHAADWRYATGDESAIWFVDTSSFVNVAATRTAWIKIVVHKEAVAKRGMRTAMMKYAAHCNTRQLQVLLRINYMEDGDVGSSTNKPRNSEEVIPESTGESLYNVMCGPMSTLKKEPSYKDPVAITDRFFDQQQGVSSEP